MATLPKQEKGVSIHSVDPTTAEADLKRLVTELFEQHHVAIYNYVYRLTGSSEWANDLTQETFLQLFRSRQKLPGIQNRRAWIYRIASNVTFNALKRHNRFSWLPWKDQADNRPLPYITELEIPGLWLFGAKDTSVPVAQSAANLQEIIDTAQKSSYAYTVFPNGNHSLWESETGTTADWPYIREIVPGYFDILKEWLSAQL